MALLQRQLIADGVLRGTVYTFEKAGDELPEHVHAVEDIHYTIIAYGAFRFTGDAAIAGKSVEAKSGGTILNWKVGQLHGAVALTDGATMVNVLKNYDKAR